MNRLALLVSCAALALLGCSARDAEKSGTLTAAEARSIATEAYVYLYPMVQNYQTIYQFALNPSGPEFKGPMNTIFNVARVFTPKDTTIVTANSDTPYSYLMLDLRTEPFVVTLPKIEANRYYSLQLVDLYTHNVDYLGTRKDGNEGGAFLIAGPTWRGDLPPGIKRAVTSPTTLMFAQFRTQLFDPDDMTQLEAIQARYKAEPLSAFLGQPAPAVAPAVDYPAITQDQISPGFWRYANFLLQWAPPLPGEEPLRSRFEKIGVRPGGAWPPPAASEALLRAIDQGAQDARLRLETDVRELKSSAGLFGTPTAMAGKYNERALGALGGIYGNDIEETFYASYQLDTSGNVFDASKQRYRLTFGPGGLPPVDAFWSLTMYDGKTRLMVENPIDRYLINSSMLNQLAKNPDGGITLYVQNVSPGAALESNWLPAPNGPMSMVMRLYLPKAEVLSDRWKPPPVEINAGCSSAPGRPASSDAAC